MVMHIYILIDPKTTVCFHVVDILTDNKTINLHKQTTVEQQIIRILASGG